MSEATEVQVLGRMRELRENEGLSMREVGRRLGMSGEAYRKKELGELGTSGADLVRIAGIYDLTIQEAFPFYELSEDERVIVEAMGAA